MPCLPLSLLNDCMCPQGDGARQEACSAADACKRHCVGDQETQLQWTCEQCTFINDGNGPSCEACNGARAGQGVLASINCSLSLLQVSQQIICYCNKLLVAQASPPHLGSGPASTAPC